MREPAPDYSNQQYERPNQPWVCGLAGEGRACPAGPTAHGHCPALAECAPVRDGDRWRCNRSTLRGGECDEGPTPDGKCCRVHQCRPVRSLRSIRGRFVTACALLAAGAVILLLSADWRDTVISPGPLARQHAQLLESKTAEPNCAACHASAEWNVAGWTVSLVAGHAGGANQAQLCMDCHEKTISSKFALAAHNLPPDALSVITEQCAARGQPIGPGPLERVACASCHSEHHGARFDLTAMDNDRCQACHHTRYESFAKDHPDFGAWPYARPTRITFNHATHSTKHFADKKQTFDCRTCHLEDRTGKTQVTVGYEAACASCHDEKIATSMAKGVPMLTLPTLDIDALKKAGHDVGAWPEEATGDFDGKLPPAMKLLLAGDPAAATAIEKLGANFEFFDIDPDDDEQLEACATLVAAIKELLTDLSASGEDTVRRRLSTALNRDVSDADVRTLVAGMTGDAISGALEEWFPGTKAADAGDGDQKPTGVAPKSAGRSLVYAVAGNWRRDDATFTVRYESAVHADPVLTGWLEVLAATPNVGEQPLAAAMLKELSNPTAAGLCASCHSVERTAVGRTAIHWRSLDPTTSPRGLTKFSHGPHLTIPQLANCTSCHAIDQAHATPVVNATADAHGGHSGFAPLSKHRCASCHTAKAAGDRCQQCHNYHVDGVEGWRWNDISDFGLRNADRRTPIRIPQSEID